MNRTTFNLGIVCAVVLAGVVTPVAVQHLASVRLREKNAALREKADLLAGLTAEIRRLSNRVAQAKPALSDEQFGELMRLRGEVGLLRKQTNALEQLREDNARLQARLALAQNQPKRMSQAEMEQALLTETREAMENTCRHLSQALRRFANDHTNQAPSSLWQLRDYFPLSAGPMLGLYSFQFVPDLPPVVVPGDALILREIGSHRKPDGTWARFYAYGDGRIVEVAAPDDWNFDAWEKQHASLPATSR